MVGTAVRGQPSVKSDLSLVRPPRPLGLGPCRTPPGLRGPAGPSAAQRDRGLSGPPKVPEGEGIVLSMKSLKNCSAVCVRVCEDVSRECVHVSRKTKEMSVLFAIKVSFLFFTRRGTFIESCFFLFLFLHCEYVIVMDNLCCQERNGNMYFQSDLRIILMYRPKPD